MQLANKSAQFNVDYLALAANLALTDRSRFESDIERSNGSLFGFVSIVFFYFLCLLTRL